jgi:hypothetical protein
MSGVAAIAAPSEGNPILYVAVQPKYKCPETPGVCKLVEAGSILKLTYDRSSNNPYSTTVVLSGVYPATTWPNSSMVGTVDSVYFIEQHPTAGNRIFAYTTRKGSSVPFVVGRSSRFFRDAQGNPISPSFGTLTLAAQ